MLGPRIGKYDKKGNPKAIPGHSLTLGALGVFILWFCWFGFNGGSTVSATGDDVLASMGNIFVTTNMSAATASIAVMMITWIRYKKPDVSMTLNGSLAGLVAVTAGTDLVSPFGAAVIGIIAGFAVVFGIEFVDKILKIDDPVGAVGVHGICGALGTILTGLFAVDGGLFYGGGVSLLLTQILGVIAVMAWVTVTITITFFLIDHTIGLRVSEIEEIEGLDIHEHGLVSAYADFMPSDIHLSGEMNTSPADIVIGRSAAETIPVTHVNIDRNESSASKITKVEIITKQNKFEALKAAMNEIGVTGITVTNVLGCGIQKGSTEYYRGVPMEMNLLPKIQIEIVVSKVPVDLVIQEARKALYTGNIGDGKIFIYNVENVIKVRTGESGYDALQGEE